MSVLHGQNINERGQQHRAKVSKIAEGQLQIPGFAEVGSPEFVDAAVNGLVEGAYRGAEQAGRAIGAQTYSSPQLAADNSAIASGAKPKARQEPEEVQKARQQAALQGRIYADRATPAAQMQSGESYIDSLKRARELDPRVETKTEEAQGAMPYWDEMFESSEVPETVNSLQDDQVMEPALEYDAQFQPAMYGWSRPWKKDERPVPRYNAREWHEMPIDEKVDAIQRRYNANRDNPGISKNNAINAARSAQRFIDEAAPVDIYDMWQQWDHYNQLEPDIETSPNQLPPMGKTKNFDDLRSGDTEGMQESLDRVEKEPSERKKQVIDSFVRDIEHGFFPIKGQHIRKNPETGEEEVRYNDQVERAIGGLIDYFGFLDYYNGDLMAAQRAVFRTIRCYAGMSADRSGNMFGSSGKWELDDQEIIDLCRAVYQTSKQYGHPFAMPYYTSGVGRTQLRGTDIYPIGWIPDVVAIPLMNKNSGLYNAETGMTSAQALKDAAMEEFNTRTKPTMEANIAEAMANEPRSKKNKDQDRLSDRLIRQRIVWEDINQAAARLDGVGPEEFSDITGIDTAQHYRLDELSDVGIKYATAMDGIPEAMAEDVRKREQEKIEKEKERIKKKRKRKAGPIQQSCNIMVAGAKTNALFWQAPIAMSAIAEKGVGDLQTWLSLKAMAKSFGLEESEIEIPEDMKRAFDGKDAYEAIDAAMILLELGGPTAMPMFKEWCKKNNGSCNHQDVMQFLHEECMKIVKEGVASRIEEFNQKLSQIQQKILTGKYAFYRQSNRNFLLALMISSAVQQQVVKDQAEQGVDIGRMAFTPDQLRDAWIANNRDATSFITDAISYTGTRDALIMMRANNIGQFNPVSFMVNRTLANHGITNAALTIWVDTFIPYGINFAFTMLPMSKTLTYLGCKGLQWNGKDSAADFAIGGGMSAGTSAGLATDPGFMQGLKMNLIFDCVTLGKWSLIGLFVGAVLSGLGFQPPPDDDDFLNLSMWRIGGNVGWGPDTDGDGKGDGIEIQEAFWLNDLTQFIDPIGKIFAAGVWEFRGGKVPDSVKPGWKAKLFLDGVYDQFDGNVTLDLIDAVQNWKEDIATYKQMMTDPNYDGPMTYPSLGIQSFLFRAGEKLTPGAPLYAAWGRSAMLRGKNARMYDTSRVYDQTEWGLSVGKTNYVSNDEERLIRQSSARNYLLAALMNRFRSPLDTGNLDPLTGYFWWEMPPKTRADQMTQVYADMFDIDYDNMPLGMSEQTYNHLKANILEDAIAQQIDIYGSPEIAAANGFFIPTPIRKVLLDEKYSEINFLRNELSARKAAGWVPEDVWNSYQNKIDENYDFIDEWLKNDAVPTWNNGYEQLLTDKDVSYVYEDGSPASGFDALFDPTIQKVWHNKGNHPASIFPVTFVDYSSNNEVTRDSYGETVNSWFNEGKTDLESIMNGIGKQVLKSGKDAGKTLNDSLFDQNVDGSYRHTDYPTLNDRAWVNQIEVLPDEIKGFTADDATGGIYGDSGKGANALADNESGSSQTTGAAGVGTRGASGTPKTTSPTGGSGSKNAGAGMGTRSSGKNKNKGNGNGTAATPAAAIASGAVAGSMAGVYQNILNPYYENYGDNITSNTTNNKSYYPKSVYSRRYYGGGSGGSYDYNPKIYSNTHTVHASRPTTMYSKTPYSTHNSTYLRPSFSTKGSREAYKRQDF